MSFILYDFRIRTLRCVALFTVKVCWHRLEVANMDKRFETSSCPGEKAMAWGWLEKEYKRINHANNHQILLSELNQKLFFCVEHVSKVPKYLQQMTKQLKPISKTSQPVLHSPRQWTCVYFSRSPPKTASPRTPWTYPPKYVQAQTFVSKALRSDVYPVWRSPEKERPKINSTREPRPKIHLRPWRLTRRGPWKWPKIFLIFVFFRGDQSINCSLWVANLDLPVKNTFIDR